MLRAVWSKALSYTTALSFFTPPVLPLAPFQVLCWGLSSSLSSVEDLPICPLTTHNFTVQAMLPSELQPQHLLWDAQAYDVPLPPFPLTSSSPSQPPKQSTILSPPPLPTSPSTPVSLLDCHNNLLTGQPHLLWSLPTLQPGVSF